MTLIADIQTEDIIEQADFFDNWEEKYTFIIELGKQLPLCDESDCNEDNLIKGCQSCVWITHQKQDKRFLFKANSDAIIVKGLLAIILTAYHNKTAAEIRDFDMDNYLSRLDLLKHISNVRGNGVRAMIEAIQALV